jgi:serine/threonine-protein kinase
MGQQVAHAPPGFEFVRPLGSGGFGDVYLARQKAIDRLVAIKEIAPHALADPDNIERFRREARVLAATHVASVVKVFDLNTRHDPAYLVMEYVPGGTLADLIEAGPLPAHRAIPILADVAEALRSMAYQGLVHRDIKPNNVFVLPDGEAKLGDFGLARALVDDGSFRTGGGVPVGTPGYFPPEVSQGTAAPDHQSDAYSFAVMAYETLTGSLPFDAPDAISMITAHWQRPPRPPGEALPGIPQQAADVLLAGLDKQPGHRPLPHQLVGVLRAIPDGAWPTVAVGPGVRPQPVAGSSVTTVRAPEPSAALDGFLVPGAGPPRWRRRIALAVGALLTVAAGVVGLSMFTPLKAASDLEVRRVALDVAPAATGTCPRAKFRFVATVTTNGAPGALAISWIRPDGVEVPAQSVTLVDDERSVRAEFTFTFRGSAPRSGRAVVRVDGDDQGSASRLVEYACPAST